MGAAVPEGAQILQGPRSTPSRRPPPSTGHDAPESSTQSPPPFPQPGRSDPCAIVCSANTFISPSMSPAPTMPRPIRTQPRASAASGSCGGVRDPRRDVGNCGGRMARSPLSPTPTWSGSRTIPTAQAKESPSKAPANRSRITGRNLNGESLGSPGLLGAPGPAPRGRGCVRQIGRRSSQPVTRESRSIPLSGGEGMTRFQACLCLSTYGQEKTQLSVPAAGVPLKNP